MGAVAELEEGQGAPASIFSTAMSVCGVTADDAAGSSRPSSSVTVTVPVPRTTWLLVTMVPSAFADEALRRWHGRRAGAARCRQAAGAAVTSVRRLVLLAAREGERDRHCRSRDVDDGRADAFHEVGEAGQGRWRPGGWRARG